MYITDFKYHKPKTLEEALGMLGSSEDSAPIAGGTDMLVEIKQGMRHHSDIVSLSEIGELKTVEEKEGNLLIGAAATHNALIESPIIQQNNPAIADAAASIGTEQIRNTGTVGGNLCTGASCCDMGPVLIALCTTVEIANQSGTRELTLKDFFINHKETSIQKGELMTRLSVPGPQSGTGAAYEKFGLRNAASISVASAAVMVRVEDGICTDACVVIGAVAPIPMISEKSTALIKGSKVSELCEGSGLLSQIGAAAAADALPIDDIRGTAAYRRDLIKTLTQRAVLKAMDRANGEL